jgi:hypothetical protein
MLKEIYYFSFFALYRSFERSPLKFWSEWKASLIMDVLIGFLIMSGAVLFTVATKRGSILFESDIALWSFIIVIPTINFFIFNHQDKWKGVVTTFEQLPKNVKLKRTIVFWLAFVTIIALLPFSFYLMSKVDWKHH